MKLAVIESKSIVLEVGEGVAQAKNYAQKMQSNSFAGNIYQKKSGLGKFATLPSLAVFIWI